MADTLDLYTTVKNIMTTARTFGYLSTHGKLLPAGAHFTQVGDLVSAIAPNNTSKSIRKVRALERDLLNNRLEIISTPAVILKDTVSNEIKKITLTDGALGAADPSWGAYTDI
jgi:hypothetical protein